MQYAYGPVHVIITSLLLGVVAMAIVCRYSNICLSVDRRRIVWTYCFFLRRTQVIHQEIRRVPVGDVTVAGTGYHGDPHIEINPSAKLR